MRLLVGFDGGDGGRDALELTRVLALALGTDVLVVTAPRAYAAERHKPFELIGVAYDGTSEATAALHRAERTAAAFGARLRLLTVVAPPIAIGVIGYVPPEPPDPKTVVELAIRSIDPKLEAESELLHGPPGRTLAEACGSEIDLIVAGSRGYGPLMRVLLGSVTRRLIHEAPCPVLIVPRP